MIAANKVPVSCGHPSPKATGDALLAVTTGTLTPRLSRRELTALAAEPMAKPATWSVGSAPCEPEPVAWCAGRIPFPSASKTTSTPSTSSSPATTLPFNRKQQSVNHHRPVKVDVYCIPTHALHPDMRLRYASGIDGDSPETVGIDTTEFSPQWSINVLRAAAIGTSNHTLSHAGKHTLKLHPLDPGVVFDTIVIDFGGLKPSFLEPTENPSVGR